MLRRRRHSYQPKDPFGTRILVHISNWLELNVRTVKKAFHLAWIMGLVVVLVNISLFLLQNGRTPLLTSINGKAYGLMPVEKAKEVLKNDHSAADLTISVGEKTVVINAQKAGVEVDADKTLETVTDKTGWERVPVFGALGDLLVQMKTQYQVDQETLAAALAPYIQEYLKPAVDASLKVPADLNAGVEVVPSTNGSAMSPAIAAEQVAEWVMSNDLTLKIEPKILTPDISTKQLKDFLPAVEAARKTSMTVQTGTKKLELSSSVLGPLLRAVPSGKAIKLTLDQAGVAAYLEKQSAVFYQAAIATRTVQQDGEEVSRTDGTPGSRLDAEATAALLVRDFEQNVHDVTAKIAAVQPDIQVTKTYSNSDAGLAALIDQFARTHAGVYRVAAIQLTGEGSRSAFYNADISVTTASIYKLYVAYGILQRIEKGTLSLDTATSSGTVGYCMDRMIIVSDNPCAETLASYLGVSTLDSMLANNGFKATKVASAKTTARDTVNLLAKFYNNEILGKSSVDYLFNLMRQQIYRQGIIAGSRGADVPSKVGFINGLYHDAGVVYSPKATYALVILTDGAGGFSNIKLLSQQIYDFYNQ